MFSDKIKCAVVDDSNFMITVLSDILEEDEGIEVIATGYNGEEAVKLNREHDLDVMLLDIEMPKMDGLTATKRIISEKNTPVVILSAMGGENIDMSVKALDAGAVDFIPKTSGRLSMDIRKKADEIRERVKKAAQNKVSRSDIETKAKAPRVYEPVKEGYVVSIASSTGGIRAIHELLSTIPYNFPAPIVIAQHMPPEFTSHLAKTLDKQLPLEVKEAEQDEVLRPGTVYVIPADFHGELGQKDGSTVIRLNQGPKLHRVRPAGDYLFKSSAELKKDRSIGIVLTGMGEDGAEGAKYIREEKGFVAVQDEETSVIHGMPARAQEKAGADFVGSPNEIGKRLVKTLMEEVN